MKSYVVRVYRHDEKDKNQIVGVIEHIEENRQHNFSTMGELINILCQQKPISNQIGESQTGNAINEVIRLENDP